MSLAKLLFIEQPFHHMQLLQTEGDACHGLPAHVPTMKLPAGEYEAASLSLARHRNLFSCLSANLVYHGHQSSCCAHCISKSTSSSTAFWGGEDPK